MLIKPHDVLLLPAAATSSTPCGYRQVVSLVVTGLIPGAIRLLRSDWLASRNAARDYQYEVRKGLHTLMEHSTGGFTGALAALFFADFVFGGIVPYLLLGLVVVVVGASVLRRSTRVETARP